MKVYDFKVPSSNQIILGVRNWNFQGRRLRAPIHRNPITFQHPAWNKTPYRSSKKPQIYNQAGLYAHLFEEYYFLSSLKWRLEVSGICNVVPGLVIGSGPTFIHDHDFANGFRSREMQIIALRMKPEDRDKLKIRGKENIFISEDIDKIMCFSADFINKNREIVYNTGLSEHFLADPLGWKDAWELPLSDGPLKDSVIPGDPSSTFDFKKVI